MALEQDTITDKRGGICFRVDDNKPIQKWAEFADVFDAHGCRFCAALNPGRMAGDSEYIEWVRTLQDRGHEIMDHTPIHSVDKLPLPPGHDPGAWRGAPGVDHVDEERIYLSYEKIDTASLPGGRADISGNRMAGRVPEDLADTNQMRFIAVYLPETGRAYRFRHTGEADNPVLELRSFWDEDNVDLGERRGVAYHRLSPADVHMTLDARKRLAEASLKLWDAFGLRRPVTWIQPGSGGCSNFYRGEVRECFGDLYGYVAAATYPDRSLKCYNEYDPDEDKSFGMQWGNFDDEARDLAWNLKRIADGVARHHVLIGHSHFWEHAMPDGWGGYLERVGRILSWCTQHRIPVRTCSEWARILYRTKQDPRVNVFPELGTDRDGDGVPDGYELLSATLDRRDGVPDSGGLSLAIDRAGPVCRVERLGGLEKGANAFTIWTGGSAGGSVEVTFDFFEVERREKHAFPVASPGWTQHRTTVTVPPSASLADISIDCTASGGGGVRIGGMHLHQPLA